MMMIFVCLWEFIEDLIMIEKEMQPLGFLVMARAFS